jgi:hypothetical protein
VQYDGEPQDILQRILKKRCPRIPTKTYRTEYCTKTIDNLKYDTWTITVDHTVNGVGSDNIQGRLPNHKIKSNEWDSYGLELVSRVFNTGSPTHKDEIRQLVETTVGTPQDTYGSFITNQTGFHVHVEAPRSMEILKELAVILVIYEEEVSRLHAPVRRPGHAGAARQLESNRLFFLNPYEDNYSLVGGDYTTEALIQANGSISMIRSRISSIKTRTILSQRMCWPSTSKFPNGNRNRLVNFTYLCRGEDFPETIEFRQARGSLDPEEISHWVDFCVGLVRLAEHYSQNPDAFPAKTFEELRSGEGVFKLMKDMVLSPEAIGFWDAKIKRYEEYREEDDRTDCELEPVDEDSDEEEEEGAIL